MNEITARNPDEWEAWLTTHHDTTKEIWIRTAKKYSGVESIRPAEATEIALCFGWIDSHRRGADDTYFLQRYSPRRSGSHWSDANLALAEQLRSAGRMRPAGLREFAKARQSAA